MSLPIKELKCGAQIHGIMDIETVVGFKHQTDGRDEVGDVAIHNLTIYTQHELSWGIVSQVKSNLFILHISYGKMFLQGTDG